MGQHAGVVGVADGAGGGVKAGEQQHAIGRGDRDRCRAQCTELSQRQCCAADLDGGEARGGCDGETPRCGPGGLCQRGVRSVGAAIGIGDGDDR